MSCFEKIRIDKTEISQDILNINIKTRSNLFTWNGQFSPQFVQVILDKYAKDTFCVLDPFLGSGTVLYECLRKNISGFWVELNASAYYMA